MIMNGEPVLTVLFALVGFQGLDELDVQLERLLLDRSRLLEPFATLQRLCNTSVGKLDIFGFGVVAHTYATLSLRGHERGAASGERIENQVTFVGVQIDQPLGQFDRKRGRVADLSCRSRVDLPDV